MTNISNLTASELADLGDAQLERIEEAGIAAQIVSGGRVYTGSRAVRTFLATATATELVEGRRQLAAQEAQLLASERQRERWADDDAHREAQRAPLTDEELAALAAEEDRARQIAERENSVESRLGRVETLLERIAKSLEKA